jgi:general secretion pathway protein A
MYERFFGLRERAFDLTLNPRFLLLTPAHREALGNLQYGVASRQGLTLLTGEAGTGKTTVLRRALSLRLEDGPRRARWVQLNNPMLSRDEFLEFLATSFGLTAAVTTSKVRLLRELEQVLRDRHDEGILSALVVDEAQCLPDDLLEEVRLLANIESDTYKLLSIVLSGQPELATRLNEWRFRHLKQRVALRCSLSALTLSESAAYIAGRIRLAGGDAARVFSREAVIAVHERARGIPRTINVICENALLTAFAMGEPLIRSELVGQVSRDFDLDTGGAPRSQGATPSSEPGDVAASSEAGELPPEAASTPARWLATVLRLAQAENVR